jgi:hypothetical protein
MPKLWKLLRSSPSKSNDNNKHKSKNNNSNNTSSNSIDNNSIKSELKDQKKEKKSIVQDENENVNENANNNDNENDNNPQPGSLIHNRLILQEFVELQKGIVNEVVYLGDSEPKDVLMKVDLLGVHIYDKDNPKTLIKDFEVEQIMQYSYERDEQYLTISYMNSEYSVDSYDFVTPDYFEIFDFIGHVIAMVIKINDKKYETEEDSEDSDDLNNFQLPRISVMYKSDSTNIFSPTFILNNFMPENKSTPGGYLNDSREDLYSSSVGAPENHDMFRESTTLINDKDASSYKALKESTDEINNNKNKTNIDKYMEKENLNPTSNLIINTNMRRFENEFQRNYIITSPKSAIETKTPFSEAFGTERDYKVIGYKKLGGDSDDDSKESLDKRSSYQCRTVRLNNGRLDTSEIPAYGKKYGTIHFRKSHDLNEMYNSELVLSSDMKEQIDKSNEGISNQTQAKVNIMKYFVENKYNIDKKKSYSIGTLMDNKDNNVVDKSSSYKSGQMKRKDDSDDEFSSTIESSKDTIDKIKEDKESKRKDKHKIHISKITSNKGCEEISPSVDLLDESESPTKKSSSQKKQKMKYNFSRPKSLQLNFLSQNKDVSKKRISIKNYNDLNEIYMPSPIDGENTPENNKFSKAQKRGSNTKKTKNIFSLNKKSEEIGMQENELEGITSEDGSESYTKNERSSNTTNFYNGMTNEIEEEKSADDLRNSSNELPKLQSNSFEDGKNDSDLLSEYQEPYSSIGSKSISSSAPEVKSQKVSRLSKTYSKDFLNSLNEKISPPSSPSPNSSNYDYFVKETKWHSYKEPRTIIPLEDDSQEDSRSPKTKRKTNSIIDMKSNTVDNRYIINLKNINNTYKSEEIISLDLNIIKNQYKDTITMSKSADCLSDKYEDKLISQNESQQGSIDNNNNNQQQLHKYKNKQIMNYRSIHGVSPFVVQSNASTSNQLFSDKSSAKGKQSHNDIYSTFKKFVGKNQKPKTPINEVSFINGAPETEENKLPQVEKEYENGKEYLIRTLKDNQYEVSAGTVHGLINEMILNNTTDIMFIDIFLLTYRHFLKANDFVLLLTEEFDKLIKKVDELEDNESINDVNVQIQKVASIIKKWVAEYFNDFLMSSEALKNLNVLIEKIKNSDKAQCQSYVDQINSLIKYGMKESEEEKVDEIEIPNENKNLEYEVDLVDILSISSKKIAQQLTIVDSKLWRSIESQEYAHFLWDSKDVKEKNTKNIQKFIERFNQISFWVSTMICKTQSLKNRTSALEKMIKIAKYCLEIQNFNTTMAILSGLNMAAVSRLKGLWMTLSTKTMNIYAEIEETMSYKSNFKNYRELEYNSKPPLIPFFGLFLKDLTFMNDGNQKILKNELINFQKLRLIYTKIKSVNTIQKHIYGFQPDNTIMETSKINPTESNSENIVKHEIEMFEYFKILPHYTEMTLLELSKKIEDSNSKAFNTIMVAKPTQTNEKNNTSKNQSLIELFQQ